MLAAMIGCITLAGSRTLVVQMQHTADTSVRDLPGAGLSGSGLGIGLQAKATLRCAI